MGPSFQIDFGAYVLLALAVLVLPLDWLAAAVLAAAFHELCHYLMMQLLHVPCLGIHVGAGGMVMDTAAMNPKEELMVAAAGPMGSLALITFMRIFPLLSVCGFVQGCFNLLPIHPLDGGRIMRCIFGVNAAWAERIGILLLTGGSLWISWRFHMGILPVVICIVGLGKGFLRKIPCNANKLGVQ